MGTQRYTITRGQKAQDVVQAAGSAVATDTFQLNCDFSTITKLEAVQMLGALTERIAEGSWPPA